MWGTHPQWCASWEKSWLVKESRALLLPAAWKQSSTMSSGSWARAVKVWARAATSQLSSISIRSASCLTKRLKDAASPKRGKPPVHIAAIAFTLSAAGTSARSPFPKAFAKALVRPWACARSYSAATSLFITRCTLV